MRRLALRALDLLVPDVPDEEDRPAVGGEVACLGVHLADERAGRVDHVELRGAGGIPYRGRDAVGREDDRRALRHLVELVDEDGAAALEIGDDVLVVNDLLADVDRRAALLERLLDDLDRTLDARAERARRREQHRARADRLRPLDERAARGAKVPQRTRRPP